MTTINPTRSSAAPHATHIVKVGSKEDPHQYSPHKISAAVGDVITFEFYPRNHSVVKADFMAPCVPATGEIFYSGVFDSFDLDSSGQLKGNPPTWSLVVNDTTPTFFYCTAIDSCLVNGMVGVINPNQTMTWEAQYARALQYPYMLVPGQSPPAEGTSASSSHPNTHHAPLSGGAIAGTVIGAVFFVGVLLILFFTLGRNRIYRKWMSSEDGRMERTARWAFSSNQGEVKSDQGLVAPSSVGGHGTFPPSSNASPPVISPPQGGGYWDWETAVANQQREQQVQIHEPMELEARSVVGGRPGGMYYGWR
ncbi:cupredoxin domain-containing protein [Aspergillus clavatus NRRL 1]|uniref:Extracellular serine-rich protein n=1 Tax=Aspergillus clavatus (strain ATCC 1007 / CBS 513.65 / DSM 816 / NCTC 3887 / NRRL 1 / QM 1276 / 107) TaxID=344612 RepID=A1CN31_ASPCL|nr:extracellular serine-rich protein [Aspergillus clavatus NRRL 1]EAW08968.1 extracellular serine-rich protein [Aspergillus clavatus NRRL 1]